VHTILSKAFKRYQRCSGEGGEWEGAQWLRDGVLKALSHPKKQTNTYLNITYIWSDSVFWKCESCWIRILKNKNNKLCWIKVLGAWKSSATWKKPKLCCQGGPEWGLTPYLLSELLIITFAWNDHNNNRAKRPIHIHFTEFWVNSLIIVNKD